jgi:hypothetical protein
MPFCILNYGVMQAMQAEERVRACGGNVELPPADHPSKRRDETLIGTLEGMSTHPPSEFDRK